MNFIFRLLVLFVIQPYTTDAARVLAIFGFSGQLQYAFAEPLLLQLAQRGHNITAITNFPQSRPTENFRDVIIKENLNLFDDFKNYSVNKITSNHYAIVHRIYNKAYEMCINILNDQHMQQMMQHESFDLILLDVFFSESLFGFGEYFGAPIVGVASLGTMISIDELVGNTTPLSYIPNFIILRPYSANMNFWLRCLNVATFTLEWLHYYYKYMPMHEKIYKYYFPNASLAFEEAQKNFSLVLVNDHFTLSTSRPYLPNMIEVAGLHIPAEPKPIAEHLKRLMNKADNGIVYINIDSMISMHLVDIFMEQFRKIPQIVLWHVNFTPPNNNIAIPANVYFIRNLSRYSILSYTNIHLFICHGNYLDIIESIHYGIPILGIPNIYGNEEEYIDFNKKIVNGRSLTPKQLNSKSITNALNDLLTTENYRRNAKLLSKRFRDQQNTPMEKAIYWIEYVLRHNGASHMRNLGQNLNMWEFYNLDVLGCFIFVIICFIFLAYFTLKLILKILRIHKKIKNVKCE